MKQEDLENIAQSLVESLEKRQGRANQYVITYKRKDNDEVIGYHADSFCSLVDDILQAKRYAGESPDGQLKICWNNFEAVMGCTEENPGFLGIPWIVKQRYWMDKKIEDVYTDAIYMADGVPAQSFQAVIINPKEDQDG